MKPCPMPAGVQIRRLESLTSGELRDLSEVLIDCVEAGASVSFMLPMPKPKAEAYWRSVKAGIARAELILLAAEESSGAIVGTVQLRLDQPENQPHRGDLAKMLVRRSARRRGVGAALLAAAELEAQRLGKTLLVLDTASGDAERLYARAGWQAVGAIPDYALWPGGGGCATTIFYKRLRA